MPLARSPSKLERWNGGRPSCRSRWRCAARGRRGPGSSGARRCRPCTCWRGTGRPGRVESPGAPATRGRCRPGRSPPTAAGAPRERWRAIVPAPAAADGRIGRSAGAGPACRRRRSSTTRPRSGAERRPLRSTTMPGRRRHGDLCDGLKGRRRTARGCWWLVSSSAWRIRRPRRDDTSIRPSGSDRHGRRTGGARCRARPRRPSRELRVVARTDWCHVGGTPAKR